MNNNSFVTVGKTSCGEKSETLKIHGGDSLYEISDKYVDDVSNSTTKFEN